MSKYLHKKKPALCDKCQESLNKEIAAKNLVYQKPTHVLCKVYDLETAFNVKRHLGFV